MQYGNILHTLQRKDVTMLEDDFIVAWKSANEQLKATQQLRADVLQCLDERKKSLLENVSGVVQNMRSLAKAITNLRKGLRDLYKTPLSEEGIQKLAMLIGRAVKDVPEPGQPLMELFGLAISENPQSPTVLACAQSLRSYASTIEDLALSKEEKTHVERLLETAVQNARSHEQTLRHLLVTHARSNKDFKERIESECGIVITDSVAQNGKEHHADPAISRRRKKRKAAKDAPVALPTQAPPLVWDVRLEDVNGNKKDQYTLSEEDDGSGLARKLHPTFSSLYGWESENISAIAKKIRDFLTMDIQQRNQAYACMRIPPPNGDVWHKILMQDKYRIFIRVEEMRVRIIAGHRNELLPRIGRRAQER